MARLPPASAYVYWDFNKISNKAYIFDERASPAGFESAQSEVVIGSSTSAKFKGETERSGKVLE